MKTKLLNSPLLQVQYQIWRLKKKKVKKQEIKARADFLSLVLKKAYAV